MLRLNRMFVAVPFAAFLLAGCVGDVLDGEPNAENEVGATSENLYSPSGVRLWTENGKVIPVCFVVPGMAAERREVQDTLRRTWMRYGDTRFTGFQDCPATGGFVRVRLTTYTCPVEEPNCHPRSYSRGMGMVTRVTSGHSVEIFWHPHRYQRDFTIAHEFGHVLGFAHEQDRPDNTHPEEAGDPERRCNPTGSTAGSYWSPYDDESIMHYPAFLPDGTPCGTYGVLSTRDKQGVIAAYGPARRLFHEIYTTRSKNDYNGDLYADASWYEPNTMEFVMKMSNGFGRFYEYRKDTSGWGEWSGGRLFSRGDFNGDGMTDWSWLAPWNNQFIVMLSDGNGSWRAVGTDTSGWGPNWSGGARFFSVGDYNGDGRDDWSWYAPWTHDFIVMLSNGVGGFKSYGNYTGGWGDISNAKFFSVGDFNGDNRDDWSMYTPWSNTFLVMLSAGNGHWAAHYYNNTSGWGNWSDAFHFRVGDFNGDGRDDWSWYAYWTHKHVVMLSSGPGGFIPVENNTAGWGDLTNAHYFSVGDYNGDNRDDWAFYAWWAHDFIVMLSNGNGKWTPRGNNTAGWGYWTNGYPFVVGDTNGDGKDDWFWYSSSSNNWHVMRSNATGNFSITQSEH